MGSKTVKSRRKTGQSHGIENITKTIERDPIIITDETWVHYFETEDKRMSMVWKHHDGLPPKKAKVVKSMDEVMNIVFLDMKGVILVHMV